MTSLSNQLTHRIMARIDELNSRLAKIKCALEQAVVNRPSASPASIDGMKLDSGRALRILGMVEGLEWVLAQAKEADHVQLS